MHDSQITTYTCNIIHMAYPWYRESESCIAKVTDFGDHYKLLELTKSSGYRLS